MWRLSEMTNQEELLQKLQVKMANISEHIVKEYDSTKVEKSVEFDNIDSAKLYFDQQQIKNRMNDMINGLAKSLDEEFLIDKFLKGYKKLAVFSKSLDNDSLNQIYKDSQTINNIKGLSIQDLIEEERLDKVIYIDSVAHALHQDKFENGTSRYKILDDLADISKAIGEKNRMDRLILLNNPMGKNNLSNLAGGVQVLLKGNGPSLEKSNSFWRIFEKYLKFGREKLSDQELILMREWLYVKV